MSSAPFRPAIIENCVAKPREPVTLTAMDMQNEEKKHLLVGTSAVFSAYCLMAVKWYPGRIDGCLAFSGLSSVIVQGFRESWDHPGITMHLSRSPLALLLIPAILAASYCAFYFAIGPLGQAVKHTFITDRTLHQLMFRGLLALSFANISCLPWNYAIGRTIPLDTLHDVITYGLLPLSLLIWGLYYGAVFLTRACMYFVDPLCLPDNHAPAAIRSAGFGSRYDYDGIGVELIRFLFAIMALCLITRYITPALDKYPRVSKAVMGLLLLSLVIVASIATVCPECLK